MSKHTPGPWQTGQTTNGNQLQIRTSDKMLVSEVDFSDRGGESRLEILEANARLIAAAPDLYEAARKALDILPPGPVKDGLIDAVLKAEGRE